MKKKTIRDLYNFMTANNTSKIYAEVLLFTDDTICETPRFYLDTGQNIGEYIEGILGYSYINESNWLPVYSTVDSVIKVADDLNLAFYDEFNTTNNLITHLDLDITELGYELSI